MPLKKTMYGGECPLGKFRIDIAGGAGGYTADPVESCLTCNFSDLESRTTQPSDDLCKCPEGMTWDLYDSLRKQYANSGKNLSRTGFREFVAQNLN